MRSTHCEFPGGQPKLTLDTQRTPNRSKRKRDSGANWRSSESLAFLGMQTLHLFSLPISSSRLKTSTAIKPLLTSKSNSELYVSWRRSIPFTLHPWRILKPRH